MIFLSACASCMEIFVMQEPETSTWREVEVSEKLGCQLRSLSGWANKHDYFPSIEGQSALQRLVTMASDLHFPKLMGMILVPLATWKPFCVSSSHPWQSLLDFSFSFSLTLPIRFFLSLVPPHEPVFSVVAPSRQRTTNP